MRRRSACGRRRLRELILDAAERQIETGGVGCVSARETAKRIGYSPGNIYNVFEDLDDVVLHVEGRVLDDLAEHLSSVDPEADAENNILALSHACLEFALRRPNIWRLLFEHRLPDNKKIPAWYREKSDELRRQIEMAIAPLLPDGNRYSSSQAALVLWAGIYGIISFSTTGKLVSITADCARAMIDDFVIKFLVGLKADPVFGRGS